MSETDLELLERYTRQNADDAFAEIVRRHVDLVHSAALRRVRSRELADEVAQSTFIKLARHARDLKPDTILTAWLYQVTRREAIDVVRREARRQLREQVATELNAMNTAPADWLQIEPLLDEAMDTLEETDRAAILLRYFENRSFRDVGAAIGASDDTAQKRVSRAVERLRDFLVKRGVDAVATGLVAAVSAHAVQAAPSKLAGTISAAISGGTAALVTTTSIIAVKTKISLAVAAALLVFGGGAYLIWQAKIRPINAENEKLAERTLATNEMLYREMLAAAPIAGEVVKGDPTRVLWENRRATLLEAGYIETRDIPLQKPLTGKDTSTFFDRFWKRFYGVQVGIRGLNKDEPPIAFVTARKTDFGPRGAIEQFIRNYDPDKELEAMKK